MEDVGLVGAERGVRGAGESTAATGSACRERAAERERRRAIALGHPYGMTGSRLTGHALIEGTAGRRREARRRHHVHRRGHGAAGLFEVI